MDIREIVCDDVSCNEETQKKDLMTNFCGDDIKPLFSILSRSLVMFH